MSHIRPLKTHFPGPYCPQEDDFLEEAQFGITDTPKESKN